MKTEGWEKLQNGSDIRGVALEGVAGEKVNLKIEHSTILGKAFAVWLEKNGASRGTVAVGTDSRISGPELKHAFIKGLTQSGFDVFDCGLASTPSMFMTTIDDRLGVNGAVMLTASHLPFNRNGMKFFTHKGGFDKKDVSDLLAIAETGNFILTEKIGMVREIDFISEYASSLVKFVREGVNSHDYFDLPLKGLKIIVDAGNGSGGFFADKVLAPLGADIRGSQFLEPNGHFPNHVPNPEDAKAMSSICDAVNREKANLGIIFDTDVDRAAIVDENGRPINRNELIALISAVILQEHPQSVVVTDSITSAGLKWFIEKELGGVHHRFRRGYKNVINESIRLNQSGNESWLAIETSGHAALKENHFLDDGAFLVSKLLVKMGLLKKENKTLSSLIEKLPATLESEEYRFAIKNKDFVSYGNTVVSKLAELSGTIPGWSIEQPNFEGVRIRCDNEKGWLLLRMSLHDPVMPLNIESDVKGGVQMIAEKLSVLLSTCSDLETSSMKIV